MLKSTFGEIAMKSRQRQKDILFSLIVFFSAFAVNLLIQKLFTTQTLVPMIFVFGVFLISLKTHGYCYGITSAIVSVFAVDFAFTYPYYVFDFFVEESILSAVIMMVVAVSTSTLNIRIRDQEKLRAESEKERMRGNLLRAISHDLRTPLTSIYGSSSTLISKYDALPKEQQLKLLGEIQEDSEWLIRMVENLLSVTRIDGAKVEVVKTPTVLDELIDSVLMKFSKKHPNQKVITQIPEEFVDIPMDSLLIEQVLLNLLENAVFHAKGMTELTLSVSLVGDKAVFEVSDNGCGLPEDSLFFKYHRDSHLFQHSDVLNTVQCVAGEAGNGFCQYKVDFALLAVLNHPVKTVTLLGMYAGDTVIRVDARDFPLRGGIDFFGVVQFLDFKTALLFFFLGADAAVGRHPQLAHGIFSSGTFPH